METFDGSADQVRAAGRRINGDISDGASRIKSVATTEIKSLIADVEDLVARPINTLKSGPAMAPVAGRACFPPN